MEEGLRRFPVWNQSPPLELDLIEGCSSTIRSIACGFRRFFSALDEDNFPSKLGGAVRVPWYSWGPNKRKRLIADQMRDAGFCTTLTTSTRRNAIGCFHGCVCQSVCVRLRTLFFFFPQEIV